MRYLWQMETPETEAVARLGAERSRPPKMSIFCPSFALEFRTRRFYQLTQVAVNGIETDRPFRLETGRKLGKEELLWGELYGKWPNFCDPPYHRPGPKVLFELSGVPRGVGNLVRMPRVVEKLLAKRRRSPSMGGRPSCRVRQPSLASRRLERC